MSFDMDSWKDENGELLYLIQNDWIKKYNEAEKVMASLPDYYRAGFDGDDSLLASLQCDFNGIGVMTGTRIIYRKDSLVGDIIHYYGSDVVEPVQREVLIPDYSSGVILDNLLATKEGLDLMQAFLLTEDNAEDIALALERLGNVVSNKIVIWTPSQSGRNDIPQRAASLDYDDGRFLISGISSMIYDGCSHGVAASVASPEARSASSTKNLPFAVENKIHERHKTVSFSNMQTIGDFNKYTAMFAFYNHRFVFSATFDASEVPNLDERVAEILAKNKNTSDKLDDISRFLHPVYAHLALYSNNELVDDVEYFEDNEVKI